MKNKTKWSNETNKKGIAYFRVATKEQLDPLNYDPIEKTREIRPWAKLQHETVKFRNALAKTKTKT